MRLRETTNEYGTPVVGYRCETCAMEFTVCPAPEPTEDDQWRGCMVPPCASYDPARDADKWFDEATVYSKGGRLIRCIQGGRQ
jgi:hypothetical protein